MSLESIINKNSPERHILSLEENLKKGLYKDAVYENFRFLIRCYQDVQCSTDKSCSSACETIKLFRLNPKLLQYQEQVSRYMTNDNYINVIEEIREKTKQDLLESPEWILRYGMQLGYFGKKLLLPQSEYKAKRLEVCDEMLRKLKERK